MHLLLHYPSKPHVEMEFLPAKTTVAPLKPEKPYDLQIEHARNNSLRPGFCNFRMYLHPRSFIARFSPVRVDGLWHIECVTGERAKSMDISKSIGSERREIKVIYRQGKGSHVFSEKVHEASRCMQQSQETAVFLALADFSVSCQNLNSFLTGIQ